jgi:hypothetical protein
MAATPLLSELGSWTTPSYVLTFGLGDFGGSPPVNYTLVAETGYFVLYGQNVTLIGPDGPDSGSGGLMSQLEQRRRRSIVVLE